jgi:hypothetical protein
MYATVFVTDKESVDYITNPTDLMNLGKDTGRLDGELSGTKIVQRKRRGSDDDEDSEDEDDDGGENEGNGNGKGEDEDGDDVSKGKKMRMSLQKGEVRTHRTYYHTLVAEGSRTTIKISLLRLIVHNCCLAY